MGLSAKTRDFWIQAAVVFFVFVLIAGVIAASFSRKIGPDDVKIAASDLRSASSTTRQLLEQYQRGEVTERYYKTHVQQLEAEVSSMYDSLNTASVDDAIRDEEAEVRDLASGLDDMLNRLDEGEADINASRIDALQTTQRFATIEERARAKAQSR